MYSQLCVALLKKWLHFNINKKSIILSKNSMYPVHYNGKYSNCSVN
jgi:hypothetical protein